jgi:two-component sensor histidine kinase
MSGPANALFYFLVTTLLLGALLLVVMERNLLSRIGRVTGEIKRVADSGSLERRVPVEGGDEITDLASLMNEMLENIQGSHEELETALKHKDLLVREVHHRVKNNLQALTSIIDYRMAVIGDDKVRRMLMEEKGSIWAIALVHQQLYESEDMMEINFNEYLNALARRLKSAYSAGDELKVQVKAEKVSINLDTALPVGLIVNELLSNSFKHAFSPGDQGLIEVELLREDNSYVMTISDSGKGLPEGFAFETSSSFGLSLVRSLVEQLDGDLEFTREPGTSFTIRFSEYSECKDITI